MNVPFLDLSAQYSSLAGDIDAAIANVIDETAFVRGRFVKEFEAAYAEAYGVEHCIGVANGTDALFILLKMLGIGPGDEVITVANSWIATSEVVSLTGAEPRFVDIEPEYFNMNADLIESAASDRTRAIIPVHLYGQPADMTSIVPLAREHGWTIIEDSAQAHLAELDGTRVGLFGDAATFSFYPGKNLGAYGDAGCIITNDPDLAQRARSFANHGSSPVSKHDHDMEGINSRLDGLQAAILSVKLPHLVDWNERRAHWASRYSALLSDIDDVDTPPTRPSATHVFHIYCIRTRRRDELREYLSSQGISTGIHYPTALPFLKAYERYDYQPDDFPIAHAYQNQILSLPIYPELTEEAVGHVADSIRRFFA
ncbi:MAG: DegT/DnrJ/EryC1/StrS family aminotransferase [Acidimicrobiia bacterium]|nr:DegT/DnrJ/EryC1/StrS family aminotransferase [Acidimicrobiia bacterium]NNC41117.1 DegT/DnrJ/EryC1/StrS family aminotransferase [Acidimicrobiia bacterium]